VLRAVAKVAVKVAVKEETKEGAKVAAHQLPPARLRPLAPRQRHLPEMARKLRYGELAISQARASMARCPVLPEASAYAKTSVCQRFDLSVI